jgi:hypothetical protein
VRYLSTTTQAITPSQGTVSWNTLDSNVQGDLGISFKNKIINGAMTFAQRGTSFTGIGTGNTIAYPADRFKVSNNDSTSVFSASQLTDAPAGFINSIRAQVTTINATPNSETFIEQVIEGNNLLGFAYGTAAAQSFTLSFWVKVSIAGQYNVWMYNNSGAKAVGFSFTVSSANTWTKISATIAGDTASAFSSDNSAGLYIRWYLDAANVAIGTLPSTWSSTDVNIRMATGSVRLTSTLNATYQLTGVQLEVGTQATTFTTAGGSYGAELALCQRYLPVYQGSNGAFAGVVGSGMAYATSAAIIEYKFKVTPRTPPTGITVNNVTYFSCVLSNTATSAVTGLTFGDANFDGCVMLFTGMSGLTAGNATFGRNNNSAGQILFTGCEL